MFSFYRNLRSLNISGVSLFFDVLSSHKYFAEQKYSNDHWICVIQT
jgi:hypothetical protein